MALNSQHYFDPGQTSEISLPDIFSLIRYKEEDPRTDAICEIAAYLNMDPAEVEKNFHIGKLARVDWDKIDSSSQSEVENYYKTTYGYIYDLMAAFYELRENNIQLINNLIKLIRQVRPANILDFGGGAGCYTLPLKLLGANISYADLKGETAKYAAWRFKIRGLDVPVLDAENWNGLGQFDFIYIFSVLEHAFDPVDVMKKIKGNLTPRGHIYLQNDFSPIEPMHLEKNLPYTKTFDKELEALGYKIVVNFNNGLMVVTHG